MMIIYPCAMHSRLSVDNVTEFIVIVGKPLSEAVTKVSNELNIKADLINFERQENLFKDGYDPVENAPIRFLLNALSIDSTLQTLIAPDSTNRLICRAKRLVQF